VTITQLTAFHQLYYYLSQLR